MLTAQTAQEVDMTLQGLTSITSAIIALVALLRPEWSILLRRWTSRLHFTLVPTLEVGYSNFGPTVALAATLRSINNDQFIETIEATVTRLTDGASHQFSWAIFRGSSVSVIPKPEELQVAVGFLLTVSEARSINVQFHDTRTRTRVQQILSHLQSSFLSYLNGNQILLSEVPAARRQALYQEFSDTNNPEVAAIWAQLDRTLYWEAGTYDIGIAVSTTHPNKVYSFQYQFALTEDDVERLRYNSITSMLTTCAVPDLIFNFAYCDLH